MDKFFTWEFIATFAGAPIVTGLIVQFTKGWFNLATQVYSYIVALIVLLVANFFLGNLTLEFGVLCLFNALLVSFTANGAYAAGVKIKSAAQKDK
jgi:hypothetical protein